MLAAVGWYMTHIAGVDEMGVSIPLSLCLSATYISTGHTELVGPKINKPRPVSHIK